MRARVIGPSPELWVAPPGVTAHLSRRHEDAGDEGPVPAAAEYPRALGS